MIHSKKLMRFYIRTLEELENELARSAPNLEKTQPTAAHENPSADSTHRQSDIRSASAPGTPIVCPLVVASSHHPQIGQRIGKDLGGRV